MWTLDGRGLYCLAGNGGRLDVFRTQLGTTVSPRAESTGVALSYTGTPLGNDLGFLTTVPGAAGRGLDIVRLAPRGSAVDTLLATAADESYAVPSPDGHWFAYVSDHSGRPEVYLRALTGSYVQLQRYLAGRTLVRLRASIEELPAVARSAPRYRLTRFLVLNLVPE